MWSNKSDRRRVGNEAERKETFDRNIQSIWTIYNEYEVINEFIDSSNRENVYDNSYGLDSSHGSIIMNNGYPMSDFQCLWQFSLTIL